jgi:hypothetical protein
MPDQLLPNNSLGLPISGAVTGPLVPSLWNTVANNVNCGGSKLHDIHVIDLLLI